MKRIAILSLLAAMLLSGCNIFESTHEDTPLVDWYPVNLILIVEDKDGNDMLDPTRAGNYASGTTISYKGETYGVYTLQPGEAWSQAPTKAYLARMKGLRLAQDNLQLSETEKRYGYFLVFGQIDGALDLEEDLVVKWNDGTEDVIHYSCSDHKVEKQKDGTWLIECQRSWQLNKNATTNPVWFVK